MCPASRKGDAGGATDGQDRSRGVAGKVPREEGEILREAGPGAGEEEAKKGGLLPMERWQVFVSEVQVRPCLLQVLWEPPEAGVQGETGRGREDTRRPREA